MKSTLWLRLIAIYLALVMLTFVLVNTYGKSLLEEKLINDSKMQLTEEADFIISEYLSMFTDSANSSVVLKMQ